MIYDYLKLIPTMSKVVGRQMICTDSQDTSGIRKRMLGNEKGVTNKEI